MEQSAQDQQSPDAPPDVNALLAKRAKKAKIQLIVLAVIAAALLGGIRAYQEQNVLNHAHPYDRALMQIAIDFSAPELCDKISPSSNMISSEFSSGTRAHLLQGNCYYLSALKSGDPAWCQRITKPLITLGLPLSLLASAKECGHTLTNPQLVNEEVSHLHIDTVMPSQMMADMGYTTDLLKNFFASLDDAARTQYHVDFNNADSLAQSYYYYLLETKNTQLRESFLQQVRGIRK